MATRIRIGIIGDFNPEFRSHPATNDSVAHAAGALGVEAECQWLPTESLVDPGAASLLEGCHGLWASAGSPYRSMEGALAGIRFARAHNVPFTGT